MIEPGLGNFVEALHMRMRLAFNSMDVDWHLRVIENGDVQVAAYTGAPHGRFPREHKYAYFFTHEMIDHSGPHLERLIDRTVRQLKERVRG